MPITNCTKCGKLYEERSEEAANDPGRLCSGCFWKAEDAKQPYCKQCGGNKLALEGVYANGDAWKCKECGEEFMW